MRLNAPNCVLWLHVVLTQLNVQNTRKRVKQQKLVTFRSTLLQFGHGRIRPPRNQRVGMIPALGLAHGNSGLEDTLVISRFDIMRTGQFGQLPGEK